MVRNYGRQGAHRALKGHGFSHAAQSPNTGAALAAEGMLAVERRPAGPEGPISHLTIDRHG